jgi:predicted transcriptional regulator
MDISETKKQLHTYIDMIENEDQLEMLNDAAQAYVTQQPDILDLLTPEQLDGLKNSIEQADNGETIPHEEVMKMAKKWIQKSK